jgi:hypothetical protein
VILQRAEGEGSNISLHHSRSVSKIAKRRKWIVDNKSKVDVYTSEIRCVIEFLEKAYKRKLIKFPAFSKSLAFHFTSISCQWVVSQKVVFHSRFSIVACLLTKSSPRSYSSSSIDLFLINFRNFFRWVHTKLSAYCRKSIVLCCFPPSYGFERK